MPACLPASPGNFSESYQAFSYVHAVPTFSLYDKFMNQNVGAFAMWAAQGKIKKKYDIDDERAALSTALAKWTAEIGAGPFAGGAEPNIADVAVYDEVIILFSILKLVRDMKSFTITL